jgi:hypothetical protein
MADFRGVPELAVSAAWHGQRFRGSLRTVDDRAVEVVHRGTWSNGFGPDFRDALILFDGHDLRSGSVEVHVHSAAWTQHGHHLDPRYGDVILHVVLQHDGSETRRCDGAVVPIVALEPFLTGRPMVNTPIADWSRFGEEVCAPDLARSDPTEIRAILWRLGDSRLAAKSARLEARLTAEPPAEVLYQELWDGFGFHANREPMRTLAGHVPLAAIESALATVNGRRLSLARGLLFGAAGFLPLSPADAAIACMAPDQVREAEELWTSHGAAWWETSLSPTAWTRARVRPANHPVARLGAAAALDGLVTELLAPLRNGADPVAVLRALTATTEAPAIGLDRARALIANALLPFALALAEQTGDVSLSNGAAAAWERLPAAESNEATRRAERQIAGDRPLGPLGSRGQQGLLHLDATLCAPRRCFECPIAERVMAEAAGDTLP